MKKIIILIIIVLTAVVGLSSCMVQDSVWVSPSTMTLSVGESSTFTYGTTGSLSIEKVSYGVAKGEESIISLNDLKITGLAPGVGHVEFVYKPDPSSTGTYSTAITVIVK